VACSYPMASDFAALRDLVWSFRRTLYLPHGLLFVSSLGLLMVVSLGPGNRSFALRSAGLPTTQAGRPSPSLHKAVHRRHQAVRHRRNMPAAFPRTPAAFQPNPWSAGKRRGRVICKRVLGGLWMLSPWPEWKTSASAIDTAGQRPSYCTDALDCGGADSRVFRHSPVKR